MTHPAVFLDKDGTLVPDIPYNCDPERMTLAPGAGTALRQLQKAGFQLVVVSNQSGVARGYFDLAAVDAMVARLHELCAEEGAPLAAIYVCPHHPDGAVTEFRLACDCRKPLPGMLHRAARELSLELRESWMVGDILDDAHAGNAAGCRTVLIDNGNETLWELARPRLPHHIVRDLTEAAAVIAAVEAVAGRAVPV